MAVDRLEAQGEGHQETWYYNYPEIMMTSSNENIIRVTGLCAGYSPVTDEFSPQRPVTWSFDDFFDLGLNKRQSKKTRRRWFETPSHTVWRLVK